MGSILIALKQTLHDAAMTDLSWDPPQMTGGRAGKLGVP